MPEGYPPLFVVTRPSGQGENLCQKLNQAGYDVLHLPAIEIVPADDPAAVSTQLERLHYYDIAIFVSANAVNYGLHDMRGDWPETLAVAAIGTATAEALQRLGLDVSFTAPPPCNSEALLSLAELQDLEGKKILVFRGTGGRELLAKTLRERGANVEYVECYRRIMPTADISPLVTAWANKRKVFFIVTSNEGLENLFNMMSGASRDDLLGSTLVVMSQRTVSKAEELGFKHKPLLSKTAGDAAVLETINEWADQELTHE